ncbi:MAG: hypothetical protein K2F71_03205, partial [Paramuribaculum sp.]|nr:hypothetical protein [Paramuribaculum sp.]
YYDYGDFMVAVIEEADRKSRRGFYKSLMELLGAKNSFENLYKIIVRILEVNWESFVAVCALLILGAVAFIAALAAFTVGGIGAIVIVALAAYGGVKAIKLLYENKKAPLAIYEVGKLYKDRFYSHIGEYSYIDSLIDEASSELVRRRS